MGCQNKIVADRLYVIAAPKVKEAEQVPAGNVACSWAQVRKHISRFKNRIHGRKELPEMPVTVTLHLAEEPEMRSLPEDDKPLGEYREDLATCLSALDGLLQNAQESGNKLDEGLAEVAKASKDRRKERRRNKCKARAKLRKAMETRPQFSLDVEVNFKRRRVSGQIAELLDGFQ